MTGGLVLSPSPGSDQGEEEAEPEGGGVRSTSRMAPGFLPWWKDHEDLSVLKCLLIRLLLKEEMLSPRSMNPRNGKNCVSYFLGVGMLGLSSHYQSEPNPKGGHSLLLDCRHLTLGTGVSCKGRLSIQTTGLSL